MANQRQKKKKKKNAAAAKQAATAYKGKNAAVKAAPVKKLQEEKQEPKAGGLPKVEPVKAEAGKPATKEKDISKPVTGQKQTVKKAEDKPAVKKTKPKKVSKPKTAKKTGGSLVKQLKAKIEKFGVNKFAAIVLAASVLIAAVCVIAWVTSSRFGIPKDAVPEYKGRDISSELTLYVTEDLSAQYEFSDKMKRKGDTKAFRYYAADELIFAEKNSQAALNLVNVSDNDCVIIASIVDEAGNICFSSRGLPAGRSLTDIGINEQPYGTHKMKLVVAGYDPETYELIGVQSSDLTVQVGIEEETSDGEETQS